MFRVQFYNWFLLNLPFHYKVKHKDEIDVCICGDDLLSGVCMDGSYTEITGVASKCSNSGSISRFNFSSSSNSNSSSNSETWAKPLYNSNSNSETWSKPHSISNSNSETWVKPHSNSNSIFNSKSETLAKRNSISNPISNPNSETLAKPDSNSNDERASCLDPPTRVEPNSNYSPTSSFNNANNRIDITNKICNRCRVIKEITCFDKKKAICKECNSTKVRCEYCSSVYGFSGLKGHIKKSHKEIDLPRSVYSAKEKACFTDEIKTVGEFVKSNPKYGEGAVSPGTLAWSETLKTDEPE